MIGVEKGGKLGTATCRPQQTLRRPSCAEVKSQETGDCLGIGLVLERLHLGLHATDRGELHTFTGKYSRLSVIACCLIGSFLSGRPHVIMINRPGVVAWLLGGWVFLAPNSNTALAEIQETCNFEDFTATCQSDEIIVVTSAELGRMRVGRCITENEVIGCQNDVLSLVARRCSGRQRCSFPVIDLDSANRECSKSLRMFLEVEYTCMKVENQCSPGPNTVARASGHLSNQIGCGSPKPHWIIRAQVGQIIDMSLIDFAASDKVESFITCKYVYGYILERALGINHTICGGKQREGALYSSKTNSVEIFLVPESSSGKSFVISFEVTGCPELIRPPNAWYKREGSEAVIGCETNDQEWRLTCTGNTWHGRIGNCTEEEREPVVAPSKKKERQSLEMPSVVVMTGFAGGALVVVVVVIVIGVVYLQRYRIRKETQHIEKTYATMGRNTQMPGQQLLTPGIQGVPPANQRPCPDHMTSYPTQWTCATLPVDSARTDPLIELSDEKEGLYNSLK